MFKNLTKQEISKFKKGYYSAKYFLKTKKIVQKFLPNTIVTLQFFQNYDQTILAGINEVLELLKKCTNTSKYTIRYLKEATVINKKEVVLELEGNYQYFGIYEGVIDGILSRATSLATNAYKLTQVANNKQIIFMGDRCDSYLNHTRDGYAIALGKISTQVTAAQIEKHSGIAIGTIPHALIQMFNGNLIKTLEAYQTIFVNEKLIALVDFNNDVINDSLKVLKHFGKDLFAIRIDTSDSISDHYFKTKQEFGVTPNLVKAVRKALDKHNGKHVKIIVSSNFDQAKITKFEQAKAPVDIYGVGKALLKIQILFTCDATKLNGKKLAKAGRKYQPNPKLITLK